jgi:hypothetical protein
MDDLKLAAQPRLTAATEEFAQDALKPREKAALLGRLFASSFSLDGSKRENLGIGGGAHGVPREKKPNVTSPAKAAFRARAAAGAS